MTTEAKKLLLLQGCLPPFERNWVLESKTFAAEAATMAPALIAVPLFSLFLEQGGVNVDVSTLGVNSHYCSNMHTE
jgi:ABC-type transport system involved in cytochrome c biogenesis permease component